MRKAFFCIITLFLMQAGICPEETLALEVKLNVPWLCQLDVSNGLGTDWSRSMNCGPAALVMSAAYLRDFSPSSEDIKRVDDWLVQTGFLESVDQYNLPEPGTGQIELRKAAGALYGLRNTRYFSTKFWGLDKNTQLKLISYSLERNYPVIVGVKSRMNPAGQHHWMVVTGLRNLEMDGGFGEVYVNDPGTDRELSYGKAWYPVSLFKSVWWGSIFLFDINPGVLADDRPGFPPAFPQKDRRDLPYRYTKASSEPGNNRSIQSGSAP